jgi:hypothetical protein
MAYSSNSTYSPKYCNACNIKINNALNIIKNGKTTEELQKDIDGLVYSLGLVTGIIAKHKLDIEDEAYEEIITELIAIANNAMNKL